MSNDWSDEFTKPNVSSWTAPLTIVYGSYEWLNELPIHYGMASLSIQNLWDDVRLMNEIPGVEKWGFEALFQRVVRDDWVLQIKKGYLGDENRFKFFPPITIALLPSEENCPQRTYDGPGEFEFREDENKRYSAVLPGLNLRFPTATKGEFPDFGNPAILTWDKKKYIAIAIDGQHRVSALRKFVPRESRISAGYANNGMTLVQFAATTASVFGKVIWPTSALSFGPLRDG